MSIRLWSSNAAELWRLVERHLFLVVVSTGLAVLLGVPACIIAARRPRLGRPLLGADRVGARLVVLGDGVGEVGFGDLVPQRSADLGRRHQHGVAEVVDALVAQLVLQRPQHDRPDHGQGQDAGEDEGHEQAPAQAAERSHGSRNR